MTGRTDGPGHDEGGSEVCLLRRICPQCGELHEDPLPDVCVRCGADLPD